VLLTEWAWDVADSGDLLSLVDPSLASDMAEHESSMLNVIKVRPITHAYGVLRCTREGLHRLKFEPSSRFM
jgi:hypothetical protein